MQTKVSTKGQVVLPNAIRQEMGLRPGDTLDAKVEGGRIVLTPRRRRSKGVAIQVDPVTGLPVLSMVPSTRLPHPCREMKLSQKEPFLTWYNSVEG
jgi:AbrB family looped-hinge helix DNA binding protein